MKTVKIVAFLKLIRWFHEVVALIPFVALFITLKQLLEREGVVCELSAFDFTLLCVCVQLLIATGCILNDIMDRDIDKINKPVTHIVNNHFSLKQVVFFFVGFSVLTLFLSIYISLFIFSEWAWISTAVYVASFAYNVYLKRSPLFGNILIAIMAGFIPLVIFYFAKDCIEVLGSEKMELLIYIYAIFPFLIIVPRELSLDISDIEGDQRDGCKTLPIVIGAKKAKIVVHALIVLIYIVAISATAAFPHLLLPVLITIILLIYYQFWLQKCEKRIEYIRAGRFLWFIMILGLIGFSLVTIFSV